MFVFKSRSSSLLRASMFARSLPSISPSAFVDLLEAAFTRYGQPSISEAKHCDCLSLDFTALLFAFLCGLLFWPFIDICCVIRFKWQTFIAWCLPTRYRAVPSLAPRRPPSLPSPYSFALANIRNASSVGETNHPTFGQVGH